MEHTSSAARNGGVARFVGGVLGSAASGAVATVPMSATMELGHAALPFWQRHTLPPRKITVRMLRRLGVSHELDEAGRLAATVAGHFGYGAACGAVYGALCPRDRLGLVSGVAFGVAVWTGSYLGWLPATGLLAPATWHTRERNAVMIAAHAVWGASLGLAARALLARTRRREGTDTDTGMYTVRTSAAYATVF